MIVFKLERERPAFDICGGRMVYVKDKYLRMHEFSSGRDVPVVSLRRGGHAQPSGLGNGPRGLSYNSLSPPSESCVLITSVRVAKKARTGVFGRLVLASYNVVGQSLIAPHFFSCTRAVIDTLIFSLVSLSF